MFNDPSVVNSRIGEYGPDGGLLRDANVCFITGKRIVPGDVTLRLGGSVFIRIQAAVFGRISTEERQAIEAEALEEAARTKLPAVAAVLSPDYEAMTNAQLDNLAKDRGIDLEGVRNKAQMIARLRLADMQARFATPLTEAEATPEAGKD